MMEEDGEEGIAGAGGGDLGDVGGVDAVGGVVLPQGEDIVGAVGEDPIGYRGIGGKATEGFFEGEGFGRVGRVELGWGRGEAFPFGAVDFNQIGGEADQIGEWRAVGIEGDAGLGGVATQLMERLEEGGLPTGDAAADGEPIGGLLSGVVAGGGP